MLKRLPELLAVRPGEGRLVGLLVGVMLLTSAGSALGSAGIETLFFTRFGVQFLPYMYMLLGVVTMGASLAITAWLGRVSPSRLYIALPLLLAVLLLASRVLLFLNLRSIYPVLWLGKEVVNTLIGYLVWGTASVVCEPRQARRLFPLFGAGRILGSVLGGLSTAWFVSWAGTENLVLIWVAAMLLAFLFSRAMLSSAGKPLAPRRPRRSRTPAFITEIRQGWQYIRGSRLMGWISIASMLFSVLYFSLALPFSRVATLQYPDEATLAGFLGTFQGLSTAAAFLASLFLANRLFARFGIMTMILVFTVIYLLGFGAMTLAPIFSVIVIFRFVQTLWLSGIADPAYQAMFNVVPPSRREQVRAFMGGVPDQAGTFIAGLVLLLGQQAFSPGELALVGFLASSACVYVIWQSRRAYLLALVEALRAGRPQVFFSQEEPFGGFRQDSAARTALIAGTREQDLTIRRVSTEILGQVHIPEASEALVNALYDPDSIVRIHALQALARGRVVSVAGEMIRLLSDPDPEVRMETIRSLEMLDPSVDRLLPALEPLLADPVSGVRIRAAALRLKIGPHAEASDLLRESVARGDEQARVSALQVIPGDFELIASQLDHAQVLVRCAAASALRRVAGLQALPSLLTLLKDPETREHAAREIGSMGVPALKPTLQALSDPGSEMGALLALEFLPAVEAGPLEDYTRSAVSRVQHYEALLASLPPDDGRMALLQDLLREKAHLHARHALRAIGLLTGREAMTVALENLTGTDASQRAAALEALESVGGRWREIMRPLFSLWEAADYPHSASLVEAPFPVLLSDADPWVRACAAFAALDRSECQPLLQELARSDPESLVRQIARPTLNGAHAMQTLATLSLMERVLFLRRVPLFEGLSTSDLKNVADLSDEVLFSDGEEFARQDEQGDRMYLVIAGEILVRTSGLGGKQRDIARRGPGDYVGEMALISQMPRMASLIASGDVRMLCIDQKSFHGLLRERPEVSLAIMKELCARVTQLSRGIDE
jgi:HEAT repeat protein